MNKYIFASLSGNVGCTTLAANLMPAGVVTIDLSDSAVPGEPILVRSTSPKLVAVMPLSAPLARQTLRENVGQAKVIIPTWTTSVCIQDAAHTMAELVNQYGYSTSDILVVFNKVGDVDEQHWFEEADRRGLPRCGCPLQEFEIFDHLDGRLLEDVAGDATDYRMKMKEAKGAGDAKGVEAAVNAEFKRKKAQAALRNVLDVRGEILQILEHHLTP